MSPVVTRQWLVLASEHGATDRPTRTTPRTGLANIQPTKTTNTIMAKAVFSMASELSTETP